MYTFDIKINVDAKEIGIFWVIGKIKYTCF